MVVGADEIYIAERSPSSEALFSNYFLHLRLFDDVCFRYYQVLVVFILTKSHNMNIIW